MGRRPMPTGNSRERSSKMASGKRASMREGPLAALFRKTEEEGLEAPPEKPKAKGQPAPREPAPPRQEPESAERPQARSAEQRLRDVFSNDIPENIMERAPARHVEDVRPRYGREQPVARGPQAVHEPLLRVVGV